MDVGADRDGDRTAGAAGDERGGVGRLVREEIAAALVHW